MLYTEAGAASAWRRHSGLPPSLDASPYPGQARRDCAATARFSAPFLILNLPIYARARVGANIDCHPVAVVTATGWQSLGAT